VGPQASSLLLVTAAFPDDAPLEAGVSHAVLDRVASGELPEAFRLARTPPTLSFGRLDSHAPGFEEAVRAAEARGFGPVHRLGGGRAAVFHEGTLAFGWAVADPEPRGGTHERFRALAGLVADALRSLGLDARIGAIPGEYCPGDYSVHLAGGAKVVGIAQRVTRSAAYTEGVIVVDGGDRIRDVLVPVYAALGLAWDPATAGDLGGPTVEEVERAVVARLAREHDLEAQDELDPETLALARRYADVHDARDAKPPRALLAPA
jgi:octanoyl-[GcvH]:protein N-octanoyltransferase